MGKIRRKNTGYKKTSDIERSSWAVGWEVGDSGDKRVLPKARSWVFISPDNQYTVHTYRKQQMVTHDINYFPMSDPINLILE